MLLQHYGLPVIVALNLHGFIKKTQEKRTHRLVRRGLPESRRRLRGKTSALAIKHVLAWQLELRARSGSKESAAGRGFSSAYRRSPCGATLGFDRKPFRAH
jgi:hypothetical protein